MSDIINKKNIKNKKMVLGPSMSLNHLQIKDAYSFLCTSQTPVIRAQHFSLKEELHHLQLNNHAWNCQQVIEN